VTKARVNVATAFEKAAAKSIISKASRGRPSKKKKTTNAKGMGTTIQMINTNIDRHGRMIDQTIQEAKPGQTK
jgi:hypothetical protein